MTTPLRRQNALFGQNLVDAMTTPSPPTPAASACTHKECLWRGPEAALARHELDSSAHEMHYAMCEGECEKCVALIREGVWGVDYKGDLYDGKRRRYGSEPNQLEPDLFEPQRTDEGECTECGEACNVCSQVCGGCARKMTRGGGERVGWRIRR
jgi:hypothetical protein